MIIYHYYISLYIIYNIRNIIIYTYIYINHISLSHLRFLQAELVFCCLEVPGGTFLLKYAPKLDCKRGVSYNNS